MSARHFDAWWKKQRHQTPDLLTFTRDDLLRTDDTADADRPDTWQTGDVALPLTYRFEPGAADDGVTVHVPIDVLARLGGDEFAWQVPALREELVTALIRSLPKDLRRNFVPAPDTARAVMAGIDPGVRAVAGSVAARITPPHRRSGADRRVRPGQAAAASAGDVLRSSPPTARRSRAARTSRRCRSGSRRRRSDAVAARGRRRAGTDGTAHLARRPRRASARRRTHRRRTCGSRFSRLRRRRHRRRSACVRDVGRAGPGDGPGTRRLLRLSVASPVKAVERQLDPRTRLTLGANPDGSLTALLDDCADAAADALVPAPVWTRDEFAVLRDRVATDLVSTTIDIVGRVEKVLSAAHEVQLLLPAQPPPAQAEAIDDVRAQLDRLLPAGFVTATGRAHLADLARYLTAIHRRLDRLPHGIEADRQRMQRVHASRRRLRRTGSRAAVHSAVGGRRPRHRLADRGAAGEPVGPTARHPTPRQRAADLPGDRRRRERWMSGPDMTDGALHRHQRSPVARDRSGHPEERRLS